jgi:hypothetical protein
MSLRDPGHASLVDDGHATVAQDLGDPSREYSGAASHCTTVTVPAARAYCVA